MISNFGVHSAL